MKKAILVMAALVAFSFSVVSNAADYEGYVDYVNGDRDYWAKGGKTKAMTVKMKTSTGDLKDLRQLGRGGVPGALFAVGTYAASIYWKDELKDLEEKSLFELFMGSNTPPNTLINDGSYLSGYAYRVTNPSSDNYFGATKGGACGASGGHLDNHQVSIDNAICRYSETETSSFIRFDCPTLAPWPDLAAQGGCGVPESELFAVDPSYVGMESGRIVPYDTSLIFPYNNGFSAYTNDEGEQVIITAEPNSIGGIDIINSRTTQNANGEEVTQESKIVMDDQGMIVNVSTGPVTPTVNIANPVNINLPDDYARENTLQGIRDTLNLDPDVPAPNHQNVIDKIKEVEDSVKDTEPLLPSLPTLPVAFGGAESCSGIHIVVPFGSIYTFDETFDKHCDIARDIINPFAYWLFSVLTAFYCWTVYREETTRSF